MSNAAQNGALISVRIAATDSVGAARNLETDAAQVTLVGKAEAGATVTLATTGETTVASDTGKFQFTNVALVDGVNSIEILAHGVSGDCISTTFDVTRSAATDDGNVVLDWNTTTLEAIKNSASAPTFASRALAMQSIAVYDTVNALNGTPGYSVTFKAAPGASVDAAISAAAHKVLVYLFPSQQAALDAVFQTQLDLIADGRAEDNGVAAGEAIAAQIIEQRSTDGWNTSVTFSGGTGLGEWRPEAPSFAAAADPQWATLQTFSLTSPDQFRASGPPAMESQEYVDAFNEVKALGAATGSTRTADQTEIAKFWADGKGTFTPPGHWNQIAIEAAKSSGNSISFDAKLFAQLNVAMADSAIAAWDTKYAYGSWRPITAIQQAGSMGNPDMIADPAWLPLLTTPNHPDHVSGHSTFSAAAAKVLNAAFGSDYGFTTTTLGLPGVTRSFANFDAALAEAGVSRIYGGIHFEFANQAGQGIGRQVGDWALQSFTPNGAPTITSNGGDAAAAVSVAENGRAVTTVTAADPDGSTALRYSIGGGADAGLFRINRETGALIFRSAPNFEAPADTGNDNVYDVIVRVSDGTHSDHQAIAVTVTNITDGLLLGTGQAEKLVGNTDNDILRGRGGDDLLFGRGGNDQLFGGAGNDRLSGGAGQDLLHGGSGADAFVFNLAPNAMNVDRIADFSAADQDTITLRQAAYSGITQAGALTADAFRAGAGANTAQDADDRVIYDTATGMLWYDADGTGSAEAVAIARLLGRPELAFGDILIAA